MRLLGDHGTLDWDETGILRMRYDGTGFDELTSTLCTRLGERAIPVEALQSIELDADVLRLVLREGADPLQSVTGAPFDILGTFKVDDPVAAERVRRDIRRTMARRDVPSTPATRWLVAPPVAPDRIEGRDATLSVAGGRLTFAYQRGARRKKKALGDPWAVPLDEIVDVEWSAGERRRKGFLRVSTARTPAERPKPSHDPAAMVSARGTDADVLFFAARLLTRIRP
ncbi:DUF4429 domain-containing protein [Kribbella sp. NPDC026611]|uniref:DUF4429 domain-containing protein n=1 Tax=Kribbella sp. NPDC026611 TaxID=3154911 RepID=UPI0033C4CB5F